MGIPKFIWVIGFIITLVLSVTTIAYFFNIDPSNYIIYLIWFVALAILYLVLSPDRKSIFVE